MTHLQVLSVPSTEVTDAGLEHLKGLTQLETLDLNVAFIFLGSIFLSIPLFMACCFGLCRDHAVSGERHRDCACYF